jgi:broad specificity phosphatase PhoE
LTVRTPASRILLVRHGRSAHVHRDGWIDCAGVERYRAAYDAAGIDDLPPPAELVATATAAELLVASDLPRAIASAERLAPGRAVHTSPLLREAPLPIPRLGVIRLPLAGWEMLIHTHWRARIARGTHATPEVLARADAAIDWLAALGAPASTYVVVTHGVFRRILGERLVARGWTAAERDRGYANWSVWPFDRTGS